MALIQPFVLPTSYLRNEPNWVRRRDDHQLGRLRSSRRLQTRELGQSLAQAIDQRRLVSAQDREVRCLPGECQTKRRGSLPRRAQGPQDGSSETELVQGHFDPCDPLEPPDEGDHIVELEVLEHRVGLELVSKSLAEYLESGWVLAGQDQLVGEQSMGRGIPSAAGPPVCRARAG